MTGLSEFVVAIAAAAASLAHAAPETATPPAAPRIAAAERMLRDYGRCVAAAEPAQSRKFLAVQPSSRAEQRMSAGLTANAPDHCSESLSDNSGLKFNAMLLRGVMAEELYNEDSKGFMLLPDPSPEFVPIRQVGDNGVGVKPEVRAARLLLQGYARCVARASPAGVHALGETVPVSSEERAAFSQLRPMLSVCLPDQETFAIGIQQLRSALTEALYAAAVDRASASPDRTH